MVATSFLVEDLLRDRHIGQTVVMHALIDGDPPSGDGD